MLTKKQIKEVREHLHRAQNPLFFFDNDQDGLCSFLLLQRYIGRGKGVPIKSFPELTVDYFRKIRELNPDYIFILDKPLVSKEFFQEVRQINLPVVWMDHHEIQMEIPKFVNCYHSFSKKSESAEAVSAFCYQISQKKEDLWIAVIGCISDAFLPDFYLDFKKAYPDLSIDSEKVLDIYFESGLGKIAQILGAGLKDKTSNVIAMLKFLMKVRTPYEILEESNKNYLMHKRFSEINEKYRKFLEKAEMFGKSSDKILFFQYGGDLSISSDLANALTWKFPEKIIVVGYVSGAKVNISVRGKKVKEITLKAIEGFEGATGGGHDDAVGAKIRIEDLEKFKERLEKLVQ